MEVYLDNAATTPLDEAVLEAMLPYYKSSFGNPSSIHKYGRDTKAAIEVSRKKIAELLNTSPSEIFFTSGGTEADNTALQCSVRDYQIKHVISSPIEHHAVLHTLEFMQKQGLIQLHFVELDAKGVLILDSLISLLKKYPKALVSLMHGNNEIGNLNDLNVLAALCEEHQAIFHTDTVQTLGHYRIDLEHTKISYLAGSAHKFHGPKGVGILYARNEYKLNPFIHGGAQERNMRGGTENVAGIIGAAKALEISLSNAEQHRAHFLSLKRALIEKLKANFSDLEFNGDSQNESGSLDHVLNASFKSSDMNDMLLFNLDINGVAASGGSACSSGSVIGSHVLRHLGVDPMRGHVRFSFSKHNTVQELDYVIEKVKAFYE